LLHRSFNLTSNHREDNVQDLKMKTRNQIKLLILTTLLLSTTMAISSTNIIIIWLSLELNIFSFIPLLLNETNINETEASTIYFLTQAIGSTIFLIRLTTLLHTTWLPKISTILLMAAILLKMGAAPCHYWFPTTIEIIRWKNCFILSTWQKIAPLFIIMYIILPATPLILTIIPIISSLNAITGGIIGLSQLSIKKIISYSSITHIGWILRRSITSTPCLSLAYLFIYSFITLPLFIIFNKISTNKVYDLWHKQNPQKSTIILIPRLLLSVGGLPPLRGFIPKLLIMIILLNHSITTIIILIIGSLLNLFFYTNIRLNIFMAHQQSPVPVKKKLPTRAIHIIISTNFLSLFILII